MDYSFFENFSCAVGVGLQIIDNHGSTLYTSKYYDEAFSEALSTLLGTADTHRVSMLYGSSQSKLYGGSYVFFSPNALAYIASALALDDDKLETSVVVGPFTMIDYDEYMEIDLKNRHKLSEGAMAALRPMLMKVPYISPERVRAISEQLQVCTCYYLGKYTHKTKERQAIQAHISNSIHQLKREAVAYPIEKENALVLAISHGDFANAKSLLNQILGHILFQSGSKLDLVRARVTELTVLLSRAALKGGADIDAIFGLNHSYLRELETLTTMEELVFWLNEVTLRFSQQVFDFASVKHVDSIYKAIAYIKENFMRKLTLEETARQVHFSSSYLSRIFKEETGYSFSSYLNLVRMEESKKLLANFDLSIVDIPTMVGFEDQSYYTKVFKRMFNTTPGKYRFNLQR